MSKKPNINTTVLIDKLKGRFGDLILETSINNGEVTHVIDKDTLVDICRFVKNDSDMMMRFLADVIGIDNYPKTPRFEVVYELLSIVTKQRLRLKVFINENEPVPSVTCVWKGAGYPEREAYDMFGLIFEGNKDLRRIYLPDDWEGFPLRKDYPLKGYKDKYNPNGEEKK
ncbi:MAG: NADH-quinone oxidoreductase subunit C [Deltaproteobacteria bacterium]|nr:NADH-quinone oxidoreductase subunit C [Deltaproteobacteria bacterium]